MAERNDTDGISKIDTPADERVEWIDIARGIGIILVVYGHALRGLIAADAFPATAGSALQDSVIYAFHMPLFFFLSGLFARQAESGARQKFLTARIRSIAYPYFLWSLIQGTMSVLAEGSVNHQMQWADLLIIFWDPIAQFWFLYALFLCQISLLLPGKYTLAIFTVFMTLLSLRYGNVNMVIRSGKFLMFFAAGVYLTAPRLSIFLEARSRALGMAALAIALFVLLYWLKTAEPGLLAPSIPYYLLGFLGIAGSVGVSAAIGRAKLLARLGSASMPIYLTHVIVVAALRSAIAKAHIPLSPGIHLLVATIVGLAIPYLLYVVARRLGLTEILGFGRAKQPQSARPLNPA